MSLYRLEACHTELYNVCVFRYYVQDAHSFWNWVYFVLLIVVGAFFMINLCLVVIATQFAETKRRETERMLQERKRMRSSMGSLSESLISIKQHTKTMPPFFSQQ